MNYKLRLLLLAALAVSSSAFATEFRTPYLSDRGPLRHSFKKLNKKKMNLSTWSTMHAKEAHKAFLKHGTDSKELTALLFNQSTFKFKEIFENGKVPLTSPNYNPFIATLDYSPRAKYFEWGATFGGRIDFPIWKEDNGCVKGRIGLRATVPFRTIEVERQDITPVNASVDQDLSSVVKTGIINVTRKVDGTTAGAANHRDIFVTAYRLDFVNALKDGSNNSIITPGNNTFKIFQQNIAVANPAQANVVLAASIEGGVSGLSTPQLVAWQRNSDDNTAFSTVTGEVGVDEINTVDAGALNIGDKKLSFFDTAEDYSAMNVEERAAANPSWLIFRRATDVNNDRALVDSPSQTINRMLQDRIRAFNVDAFTFMAQNEFLFDSYKRSGLGDIDVDVFYEHAFNKQMLAELVLGVRFPTGTTKSNCGNPYKGIAKLGNGEHFEIKLGANFAWDACKWFSVKLDASYNFVLESKEKRAAVFAGSTIKNIGPCTDADVDWGYFIGRLDFQFVHPKTCCLSTVMGYEIYYKTEDHVTFKKTTEASWLGTKDAPVLSKLDSKLARKGTESISHKARMESTYKANKYLDIFWGGAVTFAGQNVFRDMDAHGGFNVRF